MHKVVLDVLACESVGRAVHEDSPAKQVLGFRIGSGGDRCEITGTSEHQDFTGSSSVVRVPNLRSGGPSNREDSRSRMSSS